MSKLTQGSNDEAQGSKRSENGDAVVDGGTKADDGEQQVVNSEIKIDRDKILNINELNIDICVKEKVQILNFGECESRDDALTKFVNFNVDEFPNIFVFTIKLKEFDECTEEFEDALLDTFTDDRPLLIEISSEETTKIWFKRRGRDFSISLNLKNRDKLLKAKIEKGLSCDTLLLTLNSSLLDADYSTVIEYFKDTTEDPITRAINAGDELCFRLMKLFNVEFRTEMLLLAIRTKNFGVFLAAMDTFDESKITKQQVEELLSLKLNSQGFFFAVIASRNVELVKFLFKFTKDLPDFFTFSFFRETFNAVLKIEFFDVFDEFKSTEFKFSNEEETEKDEMTKNCELKFREIEKLHESIFNGNHDEVTRFAETYPHLRVCRGKLQVCALEKSIECKKLHIYAYLCCQNFKSDQNDQLHRKINKLSPEARTQLRHELDKYLIEHPEASIGIIISNCKFGPQSPIASEDVREMLLDLQQSIDVVKAIIPTVAHANVETNFDFNTKSISLMVPGMSESTLGVAYEKENRLYVGKNADKNQQYGTFVHELSHIVLYLIFENDCLPYCKGDTARETQWKKVVDDLREYYKGDRNDTIITRVFTYDESKQYIEMAVRVNEMLVYHRNEPEKLKVLRNRHPKLFAYNRLVVEDLKLKNVYPLIKLNNEFGLIDSIKESPLQVKSTNDEILKIAEEKVASTSRLILLASNVPQLLLSKIFQEIQALPDNKLNLKLRNIFIDSKKLNQVYLRKYFEDFIAKSEVVRLVIKLENLEPKTFEFLDFLDNLKAKFLCFCVLNVTEMDKHKSQNDKIKATFRIRRSNNTSWKGLTDLTKEHVKSRLINFQGKPLRASSIVLLNQKLEPQLLAILCSDTEIKVNCSSEVESLVNFIPRFIKMSKSILDSNPMDEFVGAYKMKSSFFLSVEEFVSKTVHDEGFVKIVLICDSAGSGKTTLLKKIHETFVEKYEDHWISLVSLRNYIRQLSGGVGESFLAFIGKILNLNELEVKIFLQKFTQGKVKMLFDGFDEISHVCKANTLQLFKLFKATSGNNQIFITSRAYLEPDLEKELKTTAFSLKVLDDNEQIQFLSYIWKDSHYDLKFIETCAEALVEKISEIASTSSSMIGLPLIVQGLAEAYKNKINDKFDDEIHNLNIADVYKEIIEKNLKFLCTNFPNDFFENLKKPSSLMHVLQYLAVVYLFDKEQASELGLSHDEDNWPLKQISRCGLISYDQVDKSSQFNHETCGEYLVAGLIFQLLKDVDVIASAPLEFIMTIMSDEKFKVARMFLDNMLERIENIESLKILESRGKFRKVIQGEKYLNVYKIAIEERLINVFELWIKLLSFEEYKLKTIKFPELEVLHKNNLEILRHILPSCQNSAKFERFLNSLFEFHSSNVYLNFLIKPDANGLTFFQRLAWRCTNEKNIEIFWRKVEEQNLTKKQIRTIFLMTNHRGDNVLHCMLNFKKMFNDKNLNVPTSPKVHTKKMMKIIEIMQNHLTEDEQIELVLSKNSDGETFLLQSIADSTTFDFTSKLIVDPKEFMKVLTSKYKHGASILHYVIVFGVPESFEFYRRKIEESSLDIKEMLMYKADGSRSILELSASHKLLFPRVLELTISVCNDEIKQILCENISGKRDLIYIVMITENLENLKFLFAKLGEVFDDKFVTNLLTGNNFQRGRVLLVHPLMKNLSADFLNFVWSTVKKYLTEGERVELFRAYDRDGNNLLYDSVRNNNSMENFELFMEIVKEVFTLEKDLKEYLLTTGKEEVNVLMLTIIKKYEETLKFLLNNIFLVNFKLEEFIYKINGIGENIFHLLTLLGTKAMFEYFISEVMKKLSKDKIINLLKIKNKIGHDALFMLNIYTQKKLIFLSCATKMFTEDELKMFFPDEFSIAEIKPLLSSQNDATNFNSNHAGEHTRRWSESLERIYTLINSIPDNKLNEFLHKTDNVGETFFHKIARLGSHEMVKLVIEKLVDKLSSDEIRNLIKITNKVDENVFHMMAKNKDDQSVNSLFDFFEEGLERQEMRDLLSAKGNFSRIPLHYAVELNTPEVLQIFLSNYEHYFTKSELLALLEIDDNQNNKNIVELASERLEEKQILEIITEFKHRMENEINKHVN